jgi:D-inositol-3-phosphate glycosyltransferase
LSDFVPHSGPNRSTADRRGWLDCCPSRPVAAESPFEVGGWALLGDQAVARVDVFLDGAPAGRARLGLARPDVAARMDDLEAPICGFELLVDASRLPDGARSVSVGARAQGLRGAELELPEVSVPLRPAASRSTLALERGGRLYERAMRFRAMRATGPRQPLRVLAVAHLLSYGGAQLYFVELLRRLARDHDCECSVLALEDGPLWEAFEAEGIPVHVTTLDSALTAHTYEGRLAELLAWAAPQGFSVVLANAFDSYPGVDLACRLGIPAVWAVHESYSPPMWWRICHGEAPDRHVASRFREALAYAQAMVFEAEATRRLCAGHVENGRLLTLPYAIEFEELECWREGPDRAAVRRDLGLPEDSLLLLCLGQIEPRKCQTALTLAFGAVRDHQGAALALVGDSGADWTQQYVRGLRQYLGRAGLDGRVAVAPISSRPYELLAAADGLALASDVESLPRVVLEAMALELPVVSTRVYGLADLLEDGRTGYLCEPRDLGGLAEALERFLAAPAEERAAVGRAGSRVVRERHDPRRYAAQVTALLHGAAAGMSPAEALAV